MFVLITVDQKSAGIIMASARRLALLLSQFPTLAQNFFTANSNFITRIKSHPFNENLHDDQPVVANNIDFNISHPILLKTLFLSQFINNLTSPTGARAVRMIERLVQRCHCVDLASMQLATRNCAFHNIFSFISNSNSKGNSLHIKSLKYMLIANIMSMEFS